MPQSDLIVLPGGFSYGDYLRCGAMAAHSPVMRDVIAKAKAGTPVLGICNGFQILCEAGLLPGVLHAQRRPQIRLPRRAPEGRAHRHALHPRATARASVVRMPIAHGDGNYFADAETLDRLEGEGRVAFRYCDADGEVTAAANPNGSLRNIAGIFNDKLRVLGLMPHPERAVTRCWAAPTACRCSKASPGRWWRLERAAM